LAYHPRVPDRPIAAFFDVDHTLLSVNSGFRWARHQWRAGELSLREMIQSIAWLLRYRLSMLDIDAMVAKVARSYAGTPVATAEGELRRWVDAELVRFIRPVGIDRIAGHLRQGHVVAILSSGTRYSLEPLAERLGIEHVLCTQFEELDGQLTGRHLAPACAGLGKVIHAERFARDHGIDLGRSFFYSDSYSDRAMFERVGAPVAVTPDRRLRRLARSRGWSIEDWRPA
jgi:HAD superfamily hydrolase (TIGR01490 family)